MKISNDELKLAANTIRCLSMDAIQAAKSGHPGAPMGLADIAVVLWLKYLKHDSRDSKWSDRDRFVLSGGHGSMLLYSLLHLSGYPVTLDDIKQFRQLGSKTPGHPEYGVTAGVECTTGPLGQGIAMATGMALAERMAAARYNTHAEFPIVDHRTWCFCGDGDMQEGISHEACSLAGHLGLEKLVLFYDSNRITIEGGTDLSMSDDTKKRFLSYNWHVLEADGHDYAAIDKAIKKALRLTGKPVMILCHTHIGQGAPNMHDTAASHGAPLGEDEVRAAKGALGFNPDEHFVVPQAVYDLFSARSAKLHRVRNAWARTFKAWQTAYPADAAAWQAAFTGALPADIESLLPVFPVGKAVATRSASGTVLNTLAQHIPSLIGGSADLGPSNKTELKNLGAVCAGDYSGRNIHFGIRELAMSAVMNGVQTHGGFRVYGGTFFVFSDYCRPAIRLIALMGIPVIFVFSHDSFYVGEDGPTHEPIEQLAALRCMMNVTTIRPCDANETSAAWLAALRNTTGPTALLLTRQDMAVIDRTQCAAASNLAKGAYTLWQSRGGTPDATIIATGSEVEIALAAAQRETNRNIRVVSMPSWELFERQPQAYRDSVLDPACSKRLIVEAGTRFGWDRYTVSAKDTAYVTLDTFGASGPYKVLAKHFGFTADNVYEALCALLA